MVIGPCREGAGVPFDDESARATMQVRRELAQKGCAAALELLHRLRSPS